MRDILIYVPGGCERNRNGLRELGLDVYDDEGLNLHATDAVNESPDAGGGVLFYWSPRKAFSLRRQIPQVDLKSQTWNPCIASGDLPAGRAWIGWETADPPRAADLARAVQHPGEPLTLSNDEPWLIPVARHLPRVLGLSADGKETVGVVVARYEEFWKRSLEALSLFSEDGNGDFKTDFAEVLRFGALALSVNYRVGIDLVVVNALGLFTQLQLVHVIRIASDYDSLAEITGKKKVSDTPVTGDGVSG